MLITIQNIFIRLSLKHFLSIMCCLQINLLYKDESDLSKFPLSGYTFKTIRLIGQLNVVWMTFVKYHQFKHTFDPDTEIS